MKALTLKQRLTIDRLERCARGISNRKIVTSSGIIWNLCYEPSNRTFFWMRSDRDYPIVWATPYYEGAKGIAVQFQPNDGVCLPGRVLSFDGEPSSYLAVMREQLEAVDVQIATEGL